MIVCSCNTLSDQEIRNVVTASREQPLSAQQVYDCLGCSVQCGRCARGVKRIITEASTACVERAAEGMSGLRNGGYLEVMGIDLQVFRSKTDLMTLITGKSFLVCRVD